MCIRDRNLLRPQHRALKRKDLNGHVGCCQQDLLFVLDAIHVFLNRRSGNHQEGLLEPGDQRLFCSKRHGIGKRSVPPSPRSAEQRDGVAADLGGEHVAEVGKERAALQAAGDRGREQPRDGALALLGLAAQRELAVDHRAAQAALAWLLVGSTPGTLAKLQRAGQRFRRFLAKLRWRRLRALFPAASSSSARSSSLSGSTLSSRRARSASPRNSAQAANSPAAISRPAAPNCFWAPRPSLWAVRSRTRCAQQS